MIRRLKKWASVFAKPQSRVGIDIGSSAIKVIQLERRAARNCITRYGVRRLESGIVEDAVVHDPSRLKTALKGLIEDLELRGSPVALSLSGSAVMVKVIHVSGIKRDALDEYLTWEGHRYVPYAMNEVYFDYWILPDSRRDPVSNEMDVLLVAAKQQAVESRKTLLEESGVRPIVCDVDGLALINVVMGKFPTLRGRSFGIANVGASGMNLAFVGHGNPLLVRDVSFEDTSLIQALDGQGVSVESADVQGTPDGGLAYPRTPPSFEEIIRHVQGCFTFILDQDEELKIDKMFLCGGKSKHPQLHDDLQRALGIPTISLNPFAEIDDVMNHQDGHALVDSAHLGGVALGLALHKDNHDCH